MKLDLTSIENWKFIHKAIFIIMLCLTIIFFGFWWNVENREELFQFLSSQDQNLSLLNKKLKKLLPKISDSKGVPSLIENISYLGVENQLNVSSLKLLPAVKNEFYAELPINIIITGEYQNIIKYIHDLLSMNKIITLHDFILKQESVFDSETLKLQITAKIPIKGALFDSRIYGNQPKKNLRSPFIPQENSVIILNTQQSEAALLKTYQLNGLKVMGNIFIDGDHWVILVD